MTSNPNPEPANPPARTPNIKTITGTARKTARKAARKTARKKTPRRQPSRNYTADQKAQAVLAAWTEKMNQSEICRQLEINYVTFQNWQGRAMEGMLQALENNVNLTDGAILSPRLRKLIQKRRASPDSRLDQRLRQIQEERDTDPSV